MDNRENDEKEIINDFLKLHENELIKMCIEFSKENGLGALFCTLIPNTKELDLEYFKLDDLDGNFKKRILENPKKNNTIYYAIRLYKKSYIFEKDIGINE
jgi:hypothetical protein